MRPREVVLCRSGDVCHSDASPLSGSEKVFHELSDVGRGDVTGSNEIKRFPMSTCCRISNEDTHFSKGPFGFVSGVTFWMRAYPVYGASSVGKGS